MRLLLQARPLGSGLTRYLCLLARLSRKNLVYGAAGVTRAFLAAGVEGTGDFLFVSVFHLGDAFFYLIIQII